MINNNQSDYLKRLQRLKQLSYTFAIEQQRRSEKFDEKIVSTIRWFPHITQLFVLKQRICICKRWPPWKELRYND